MRILVLSNAAWDDRNSVGNTQSNWFSDWPGVELCSMYTRESLPNNKCCFLYYQVTVSDIGRHFFARGRIGHSFMSSALSIEGRVPSSEEKIVTSITGWRRLFLQEIVELIYSSKIWFNKKIKNFIIDFNPDIVFCFAIAEPFRYYILKYVKDYTHAKIVTWIADDVYGQTETMKTITRQIYRKRYRALFNIADKVYGVSQMLCDEYSRLFSINIEPLYKGCVFTPCKLKVNYPIQMIYAGNLLYGRDQTLSALVSSIRSVNKDGVKIQLSIYSTTKVSHEVYSQLCVIGSSQLCGPRPYDEIKQLMSKADIVLHVESFDDEQMNNVRLSFSTKIIDCMQSGSSIMAIGPKGIASIEYLRSIKGVIVIDELAGIQTYVRSITEHPDSLIENANSIQSYAGENHSIDKVRSQLLRDFKSLMISKKGMID